jgi:hypothetical protein
MANHSTAGVPIEHFLDLHWFTGIWVGGSEDYYLEEHWSTSHGDVYMGMFRMVREDSPVFYEFMTLAIEDDEIILRIKHFYPGLKGWETKDESASFVLVGLEPGQAVFFRRNFPEPKWMVYQRSDSTLEVHFETAEGKEPDSTLRFGRV